MSNKLSDSFAEYKRMKIPKGEIAAHIGVTAGYLSKILSGAYPLTEENAREINKKYGHIATVEPTEPISPLMINEKINSLRREFEDFRKKVSAKLNINSDESAPTSEAFQTREIYGGAERLSLSGNSEPHSEKSTTSQDKQKDKLKHKNS